MTPLSIPDTLITTYLQMYRSDFQPAYMQDDRASVEELVITDVPYYRFLYNAVGEQWNWIDRLLLTDDELRAVLNKPNTTMFVLYYDGAPAGYFELHKDGKSTEIVYFGLRERFFGKGLGKHLLSIACETAFEAGAERVWLHTCNLDSPQALANYKKRGFKQYDEVREPMPNKEFLQVPPEKRGLPTSA